MRFWLYRDDRQDDQGYSSCVPRALERRLYVSSAAELAFLVAGANGDQLPRIPSAAPLTLTATTATLARSESATATASVSSLPL